jgi:Na+/melibiose symporter-like transporter
MDSAATDSKRTSQRVRDQGLFWLCIIAPWVAVIAVTGWFFLGQSVLPEHWVIHVDGHGNMMYGTWWPLFAGTMVLAGLAFLLGQYLVRDFTNLGHWYHQQKGIIVCCFSVGFAMLGFLVGNMLSASGNSEHVTAEASMGYGLLFFVLIAVVATTLYTWLLPRAQQIPRT